MYAEQFSIHFFTIFRYILQFYRHSEIIVPDSVSIEEVRREALLFNLPEDVSICRRSGVLDLMTNGDRGVDIVKMKREAEANFVQWYVILKRVKKNHFLQHSLINEAYMISCISMATCDVSVIKGHLWVPPEGGRD